MIINYAVTSTKGSVRDNNQDNYYVNGITKNMHAEEGAEEGSSCHIFQNFAVCDGMGGEDSGEVAAHIAVNKIKEFAEENLWFEWKNYLVQANEEICAYSNNHFLHTGTTFAGMLFQNNRFLSINTGDTRIYWISEGILTQLSKDHTEFQVLIEIGKLQKQDFHKSNAHNRLTQYLGIDPKLLVLEPFVNPGTVRKDGEFFLICSDGLYGSLEENQIISVLNQDQVSLKDKCDQLVDLALTQGSKDNITAMLLECQEVNDNLDEGDILEESITIPLPAYNTIVFTKEDYSDTVEVEEHALSKMPDINKQDDDQKMTSQNQIKSNKVYAVIAILIAAVIALCCLKL